MINRINGVLNEGGISSYRGDLNTGSIRDSWRQAESADPDRSGMIENGYVQGHYALWDGILANENIRMIDSAHRADIALNLNLCAAQLLFMPPIITYNDMPANIRAHTVSLPGCPSAEPQHGTGGNVTDTSKYNMRSAYRQSMILNLMLIAFRQRKKPLLPTAKKVEKAQRVLLRRYLSADQEHRQRKRVVFVRLYEQRGAERICARVRDTSETILPNPRPSVLRGSMPTIPMRLPFADQGGSITATGAELMSTGVLVTPQ